MGDYSFGVQLKYTSSRRESPKFVELKFGGINREDDMRWLRERRELEENRARVDPEAVQSLMRRFFSFGHLPAQLAQHLGKLADEALIASLDALTQGMRRAAAQSLMRRRCSS